MALAAPTAPTRRTISSYDLSSGDNPGAVISQPLLNGRNYDEWAQNLRMALRARKKFAFIDGSIPKPTDDSPDLEDWLANNHLLVTWIKLTIEPKLRSNISHKEVGKDLWDHIKRRLALKTGARFQQLRGSLANCRQMGSSVEEYFGRLTKIWDAMNECLVTKTCSCGQCTCDLVSAHERERDTVRVHDFLFGLDDVTHEAVRSQICAQIPLPDLDTVYQTIMQNETVQVNAKKEAPPVMNFAVQASQFQPSSSTPRRNNGSGNSAPHQQGYPKDSTVTCKSCGRTGHMANMCFRVIGFPEWWGDRPRNRIDVQKGRNIANQGNRNSSVCANATQIVGNTQDVSANLALTEADRHGLTGFSDAQWQTLVKLLNPNKAPDNTRLSGKDVDIFWVLDTGTTHHMTGRLDLLQDLRPVSPVFVKLATGKDALSSQQGTIRLASHLQLRNVYYVEGFHTNLISHGQLVTDHSLVGQVTDRLIILQDRTTRMLIGEGEREGEGLYHFRGVEIVAAFQTVLNDEGVL